MAQGRTKEAIAILEPLIEHGEPITDGRFQVLPEELLTEGKYQLAVMLRASGQNARAQTMLAAIASNSGGSVAADAQFLLAQEYVESGRFADALPLLKRYLDTNPKGQFIDFALADLLAAQLGCGQLDAARQTLATLARQFPGSKVLPASSLRLAEAELTAHRPTEAAALFRSVANTDPVASQTKKDPSRAAEPSLKQRSLTGLGRALVELGKPSEAAAAFESALALAGDPSAAADLAMLRARALDDSKQDKAALDAYADAASRFKGSQSAQLAAIARARLLVKLGRHAEASAAYEQIIASSQASKNAVNPVVPLDALLGEWGWSLVDSDKPADADRVFQRLLDQYPHSPHAIDARFNLAESANLAKDYPRVVSLLDPLVTRKTSDLERQSSERLMPAVLYRFGRTQVELKNWKAAGETLDRLLKEFPNNPYRRESEALRAEVASRQGDMKGAETRLATLLAEAPAPTDPPGFVKSLQLERIQCWVGLKRWNDVLDLAPKRKAESPPGDPAIAELDFAIGQALVGQGKLADARSAFQAVIDARRTGELAAQAQLMRGETFYHQEQFREALREFLRVSIMYDAPRWQAAALLEAGKVYERLDQWPDAAETYGRLLSKFPTEPAAMPARQRQAAAVERSRQASGTKG
jgi:TolA-binding protein